MNHLNVRSPIPLYYQLQEFIRGQIESGELAPNDPLPTEAEFCQMFNVSRYTVREALRGLAERGLIEKRQGIGSFVSEGKIGEVLPGLTSFSEEMKSRGLKVRSEVLEQSQIVPPHRVSNALNLYNQESIARVKRLRFLDEKPVVISTSYLAGKVASSENFSQSIYAILATKYDCHIKEGVATIEAGSADEDEALHLMLEPRDPVLRITWLARTSDGIPIEYSEGTYRGDSYRYIVQLRHR